LGLESTTRAEQRELRNRAKSRGASVGVGADGALLHYAALGKNALRPYKFGHRTDSVMVQRSLGLGSTAPPEG